MNEQQSTDQAENTVNCLVCGKTHPMAQTRAWATVRPNISAQIARDYPQWEDGQFICALHFAQYRRKHIESLLENDAGEITDIDQQVVDSLSDGGTVAVAPAVAEAESSFGDKAADKVATFGGSWGFIITFSSILIIWMTINTIGLLTKPFDPYPFILLNLVLSSIAAFQAPIIMMSQRRKDAKDRQRAENNYQVNLKSELEIRQLHEKLDHQIMHQWVRLNELQSLQIDLLEERNNS